MALLFTHAAQLLTLAGPDRARRGAEMRELGVVRDGALLCAGGRILRAGPTDDVGRALPPGLGTIQEIDCRGQLVAPGLCDSHTHLVFAAPRLDDYERRLAGASYQELAAAGGGIRQSVAQVRAAGEDELARGAAARLRAAQGLGTTTLEIKSGYGLELEAERKMLRAAARAAAAAGGEVARTFLGAHTLPAEFAGDRTGYVREVRERMLPALHAGAAPEYGAEFADAFCDPAGFSAAECRAVLETARGLGMKLKLHAEQFAALGGIGLGIELGAVSVDHCDAARPEDAARLARAETVATLAPGANFFLGQPYPPARMLLDAGAAVALASDCNPGTCPILSLPLVMSLACSGMRMSAAEAWTAATINGAAALGRAAVCGSLRSGKRADAAVFAADDYRAIPYFAGHNLCRGVAIAGEWRPNHGMD